MIGFVDQKFSKIEQQDSLEFLRLILTTLDKDLNRAKANYPYKKLRNKAEPDEINALVSF